jgi:hypothetical protein
MLMVDAHGTIVSPALVRHFLAQLSLKFWPEDICEGLDFWAEMHPAQRMEYENRAIFVQQISGPENWDGMGIPRKTFAGLPLEENVHLSPSVILIRKNHEIVAEIVRLGLTKWDAEVVNA